MAVAVVREAGERVHAAGLPGNEAAGEAGVSSQSYGFAPSGTGLWSIGGAIQLSLNCGRGNGCCEVARPASDSTTTTMLKVSAILRAVMIE